VTTLQAVRFSLWRRVARESKAIKIAEARGGALDKHPNYLHNEVHIVLGEFEYVLITAAAGLGESAYGAAIS
jgi:hypothetical protein